MNAKTALCLALLEGKIINIKNAFETMGISNAPREISRMIEKPFGITISRHHMTGKSRYGTPISWTNYRLNKDAAYNQDGIKRMKVYINSQLGSLTECKTEKQLKQFVQQKLFLDSL